MRVEKQIVVFDAMGVVYPFQEGDDVTYGVFSFLKEKGYDYTQEQKAYWEKSKGYNQATRGQMSSTEALRLLVADCDTQSLRRLEEEYLWSSYFKLDEELLPMLEHLKRDYLIAMLSNDIPRWSLTLRKRFNLDQHFDFFVISGEGNQARKPEKEIYLHFLEKMRSQHRGIERIYFIDDSLKNLRAAHEFAIKTIYRILKTKDPVEYVPDYKISRLSELQSILLSS